MNHKLIALIFIFGIIFSGFVYGMIGLSGFHAYIDSLEPPINCLKYSNINYGRITNQCDKNIQVYDFNGQLKENFFVTKGKFIDVSLYSYYDDSNCDTYISRLKEPYNQHNCLYQELIEKAKQGNEQFLGHWKSKIKVGDQNIIVNGSLYYYDDTVRYGYDTQTSITFAFFIILIIFLPICLIICILREQIEKTTKINIGIIFIGLGILFFLFLMGTMLGAPPAFSLANIALSIIFILLGLYFMVKKK